MSMSDWLMLVVLVGSVAALIILCCCGWIKSMKTRQKIDSRSDEHARFEDHEFY